MKSEQKVFATAKEEEGFREWKRDNSKIVEAVQRTAPDVLVLLLQLAYFDRDRAFQGWDDSMALLDKQRDAFNRLLETHDVMTGLATKGQSTAQAAFDAWHAEVNKRADDLARGIREMQERRLADVRACRRRKLAEQKSKGLDPATRYRNEGLRFCLLQLDNGVRPSTAAIRKHVASEFKKSPDTVKKYLVNVREDAQADFARRKVKLY